MSTLIDDGDPDVRARALKAVGELGRMDLLPHLRDHSKDPDPKNRFYAAWSSVLLGDKFGVDVLRTIAEADNAYAARACTTVMRKMVLVDAGYWLDNLHRQAGNARLVSGGWGALGDPVAIPFLLGRMRIPELARPAGEAFSMITGVDIAYEDLDGEWPEGFEAGPTENPEDENVEMDPDEDLPWPDAALIEAWWDQNRQNFTPGTRYLLGKPIGPDTLTQALKGGYQRQRIAAALELTLSNPGTTLFECRAPGFRQQKMLGKK